MYITKAGKKHIQGNQNEPAQNRQKNHRSKEDHMQKQFQKRLSSSSAISFLP